MCIKSMETYTLKYKINVLSIPHLKEWAFRTINCNKSIHACPREKGLSFHSQLSAMLLCNFIHPLIYNTITPYISQQLASSFSSIKFSFHNFLYLFIMNKIITLFFAIPPPIKVSFYSLQATMQVGVLYALISA